MRWIGLMAAALFVSPVPAGAEVPRRCAMTELISGRAVFADGCSLAVLSTNRSGPVRPLLADFRGGSAPAVRELPFPPGTGDLFAQLLIELHAARLVVAVREEIE